jgi:hypothetical protein
MKSTEQLFFARVRRTPAGACDPHKMENGQTTLTHAQACCAAWHCKLASYEDEKYIEFEEANGLKN